MRSSISMAVLALSFSIPAYSSSVSDTKIESFLDQTGVAIYSKFRPVGEYLSSDSKPIKFTAITASEIGSAEVVKGVEISIGKSKHSDVAFSDYFDQEELPSLISNLRKVWNHNSTTSEEESGALSVRTNSGISILLIEPSKLQTKDLDVKRFLLLATGDASDELEKLNDPRKIDKIDGLAVLPMEGLKDVISILDKASN